MPGEYYELLDGSLRGAAATLEQTGLRVARECLGPSPSLAGGAGAP